MPRFAIPLISIGLFAVVLLGLPGRAVILAPAAAAETGTQAEAGGHAEAEPNILEFKPSLSIATLIVFGALLAVLWKFAWGPLTKALHDREDRMTRIAEEAERSRSEAERLLAEHRAMIEQAGAQVRTMLEEARKTAQVTGDEIVKKSQTEAEAARQRAERDIATARDQALTEIWTKTADLAVNLAGKVLTRELQPEDHRRLVEAAMAELPASHNGHGSHGS